MLKIQKLENFSFASLFCLPGKWPHLLATMSPSMLVFEISINSSYHNK